MKVLAQFIKPISGMILGTNKFPNKKSFDQYISIVGSCRILIKILIHINVFISATVVSDH
jgi:hypothetical protein